MSVENVNNKLWVFISQPMNGLTDDEIVNTRIRVTNYIVNKHIDRDVYIIPSYITEDVPCESNQELHNFARSIDLMSDADIVFFVKGYEKSRGCMLEHAIASAYGLKCEYEI